jgi:hypothetical protein
MCIFPCPFFCFRQWKATMLGIGTPVFRIAYPFKELVSPVTFLLEFTTTGPNKALHTTPRLRLGLRIRFHARGV